MADLLNEDDPDNISSRGDDVLRLLREEGDKARKLFAFSATMNDRRNNRRASPFDEAPEGFAGRAKAYLSAHTEDFDADEFDDWVQSVDDLFRFEQVLDAPDSTQARRALALEAADGLGTEALGNVLQRLAQPSPEVARPVERQGVRIPLAPDVVDRNEQLDNALAEARNIMNNIIRQNARRNAPDVPEVDAEVPYVEPQQATGKGDIAGKIGKKLFFGTPLADDKRINPLVGDLQDDGSFRIQSVARDDDGAMQTPADAVRHIKEGGDLAQVPDEYLMDAMRANALSMTGYRRGRSRGDLGTLSERFVRVETAGPGGTSSGATLFYARDADGAMTEQGYIFKPLETLVDGNVREAIGISLMQELGFAVGGVRFDGKATSNEYRDAEHTMLVTNLVGSLVENDGIEEYGAVAFESGLTVQQRFEHGLANGILAATDRHGANAMIIDGPDGKQIAPIDFGRGMFYDLSHPGDMVTYLQEDFAGFGRMDPSLVDTMRRSPEQYRDMVNAVIDRQVASLTEFLNNKDEFQDYVRGFAGKYGGEKGFNVEGGIAETIQAVDGSFDVVSKSVEELLTRVEDHVKMLRDQKAGFVSHLIGPPPR